MKRMSAVIHREILDAMDKVLEETAALLEKRYVLVLCVYNLLTKVGLS